MNERDQSWADNLNKDGFAVVAAVMRRDRVDWIVDELSKVLHASTDASIRTRQGSVYAARNILSLWPTVSIVWREGSLPAMLEHVLGTGFGLVRVLFFDKPPEQTWSLPWHKDLTIAVRDNRLASAKFVKPTHKAGVPHVASLVDSRQQCIASWHSWSSAYLALRIRRVGIIAGWLSLARFRKGILLKVW